MIQKKLGKNGPLLSAMGLGCMGMSEFYGPTDEQQSIATIHRALELGVNFLDTAEMYGPFKNEELLGKAIKGKREQFFVATKFGIGRDPHNSANRILDSKPETVRKSVEGSLKRLGIDTIDLYYQHRVDPNTPIEETVAAMAQLVKEGKVRYLGLSEAGAATLRKACKIHPITALQSEFSLWSRDVEGEILNTCKELGIGLVAYSPLGRGFLTGQIKKYEDLAANDYRRIQPRFMGENFQKNWDLVRHLEELSQTKKCSTSQIALAWVMAQGENIIPIPGTKRISYLESNVKALEVNLTAADLKKIDEIAPKGVAAGTRYPESMMSALNR